MSELGFTNSAFTREVYTQEEADDAADVVRILRPVIPALQVALEPRSEVVLHDLTKLPRTIAVIAGDITGRGIGGPPTDLGLRNFSSGWGEHLIGYRAQTDAGVNLRCSSLFFHARTGRAVACLCINTDIEDVLVAERLLASLSVARVIDPALRTSGAESSESFPPTVDALAAGILKEAITKVGVPVDLMKKRHKISVIRDLRDRGFFMIRDSIELAGEGLQVGRHTIYNYLNAIDNP